MGRPVSLHVLPSMNTDSGSVFQKWLWGYRIEEEVEAAWRNWTVANPNFKRKQFISHKA